jgi:hypothetical protein
LRRHTVGGDVRWAAGVRGGGERGGAGAVGAVGVGGGGGGGRRGGITGELGKTVGGGGRWLRGSGRGRRLWMRPTSARVWMARA